MTMTAPQSAAELAARTRFRLLVRGAVQGVGFRPFVYQHAQALGLKGWVSNSAQGVTIEVEGRSRLHRVSNGRDPRSAASQCVRYCS
jgi:hydrogenase maturation protein HypF